MTETSSSYIVPDDLPCIYADDVANLSSTSGVLRFFLTRSDALPDEGKTSNRAVAQIIMPKAKLIEMAIFFRQSLGELAGEGALFDDELIKERLMSLGIPLVGVPGSE
jgi:hypothetical protein